MTDPDVRAEPATEVLDLYDVLPDRAAARATEARSGQSEDDPVTSMIKGAGRNLAVIIGMFAVSLAAFVACTTLFSLGVGLIVLVVGLFILVACLIVAGWSSRMTMALSRCRAPAIQRLGQVSAESCGGWPTPNPGAICCTC
jgi:Putative sensor